MTNFEQLEADALLSYLQGIKRSIAQELDYPLEQVTIMARTDHTGDLCMSVLIGGSLSVYSHENNISKAPGLGPSS